MTGAEAADILKRCSLTDLVKLVAIKAAEGAKGGDVCSQGYTCEATVAGFPTMVARVRITKKRIRKGGG